MQAGQQLVFLLPEVEPDLWADFAHSISFSTMPNSHTLPLLGELQRQGLVECHLNAEAGICPVPLLRDDPMQAIFSEEVAKLKNAAIGRAATRAADAIGNATLSVDPSGQDARTLPIDRDTTRYLS